MHTRWHVAAGRLRARNLWPSAFQVPRALPVLQRLPVQQRVPDQVRRWWQPVGESLLSKLSQPIQAGFMVCSLRTLILEGLSAIELFWDQRQRNGEGKYITEVEGESYCQEPGNNIVMIVVMVLTITCRVLAVSDLLFCRKSVAEKSASVALCS